MEDLIVVTGYGPFNGHEVNASGESVKLLPKDIKVGNRNYKIETIEIPVEYSEVDLKVQEIWKMRPHLVVHCGELVLFKTQSFDISNKTLLI